MVFEYCDWKSIECPHTKELIPCSRCSKGHARNPTWVDRSFKQWKDDAKALADYRKNR